MAHHGSTPWDEKINNSFDKFFGEQPNHLQPRMNREAILQNLGATGKKPDGEINQTDEGEIQIGIAAHEESGTVVMNFGKSVAWVGFTKEQAILIAKSLLRHAEPKDGIPA